MTEEEIEEMARTAAWNMEEESAQQEEAIDLTDSDEEEYTRRVQGHGAGVHVSSSAD